MKDFNDRRIENKETAVSKNHPNRQRAPLAVRARNRLLLLWEGNPEAAKQYLTTLVLSNCLNLSSVGDIPLPLYEHARRQVIEHQAHNAQIALANSKAAEEYAEKVAPLIAKEAAEKKEAQEEVLATVSRLKGMDRLVFLAGLPPMDRDRLATSSERSDVIALQKDSLLTTAARELLQCTLGELNRWEADGRLPCLYVKRIQMGGKTVEARFWNRSLLVSAKFNLDSWREQDGVRRKFKRSGMKIVKPTVSR